MIHDQLPEITEEFTLTVTKADGTVKTMEEKNQKTHSAEFDSKLDSLAKEVLNERRRKD